MVPKRLRDQLGFSPDRPLEAEVVEGHLELSLPHESAAIVEGPNGPVVGATGTPLSDEQVRQALEAVRERA